MARSTLILGGGVGGIVAANTLRERLPREHRIVLVDREPRFALAASFLWVMNGKRTAQCSRRRPCPVWRTRATRSVRWTGLSVSGRPSKDSVRDGS